MKRLRWIYPCLVLLLTGHLVTSQSLTSAAPPGLVNPPVLPTYSLDALNLSPIILPSDPLAKRQPAHLNAIPFLSLSKTGPTYAEPGGLATYEIQLANYEHVTRSITLTEQLPDSLTLQGIEVISGTQGTLHYSRASRTLSWQGELAGGHLDYSLNPETAGLPYIDLGDYGAGNLCAPFLAAGQRCDDVTVTFNLGIDGRSFPYYGRAFTNLTLSSDGLLLMQTPLTTTLPNRWLPAAAAPGQLLASLWRDNDLTASGRWHAGIIAGWINGLDVFYAQWQDAPQAVNANATARHAIALTLGPGGGDIFFLYDNIADPAAEIAQGYTIGLQDGLGARGVTYAYAAGGGDPGPPLGYPPAPGTVLHWRPVLLAPDNSYRVTFRYHVRLQADLPVGSFIPTTAIVHTDSPDPALNFQWASHYLLVRHLTYLPLVAGGTGS